MAGNAEKPDIDPQEVAQAEAMWDRFVRFSKGGVGATVIILALMAVFLL
jgi:hypothetical protein